jgi:hypothetical protein
MILKKIECQQKIKINKILNYEPKINPNIKIKDPYSKIKNPNKNKNKIKKEEDNKQKYQSKKSNIEIKKSDEIIRILAGKRNIILEHSKVKLANQII